MKDFELYNPTKLRFRNDPKVDLSALTAGKNVLFIYGGGSVRKNGCYDDVKTAVESAGGHFFEHGGASREFSAVKKGIRLAEENHIDMIIGAGGASIMDCSKLTAFGFFHKEDLWDYVKGKKDPYGLKKLPLILIPTYPSSGSEYGLGAVSIDSEHDDFGTAYGIPADYAFLVPKYSLSLGPEMTAYTGLVTLVQLSAATLGDRNPVSYGMGISVIRNVLEAAQILKDHPEDTDARGVILYGASLSTSRLLGLGKEDNYAYDIYEIEFIPEVLFHEPYRKALTTIFPQFLKVMARYHEADITRFLEDAFGFTGSVEDSVRKLTDLFESVGVDMHFKGEVTEEAVEKIPANTSLSVKERVEILRGCLQ